MSTLIECCKPLIPIRTSLISRSQRPIHVHPRKISVSNFKYCNNGNRVCCFSSPGQSTPFIDEKSCEKINGGVTEGKSSSELWLYNTMRKQTEVFRPKVPGKVGMYVCGVTAYDLSHIGHPCVYVCFDVLYRYLRQLGYEVYYVHNFTNVDDKIIARANELGEDPISLSRCYCEEFHQDMVHLHCLPPSVEPRVSEHMPQIIDMITQN